MILKRNQTKEKNKWVVRAGVMKVRFAVWKEQWEEDSHAG